MRKELRTDGAHGLTLALREADELASDLLDLALAATGADRVALLLLDDDGTLRCRSQRGDPADDDPAAVAVAGLIREALESDEPVIVTTTRFRRFPPEWRESLGARSAVLAALHTAEGPLGLLAFGWDNRRADDADTVPAATSAASVARVLDGAIEAEVERSRSIWRETALDAGREPTGRALAAIYLRAGLLRLAMEDGEPAGDAAEIERLARSGLEVLRRSEESLHGGGSLSDELIQALVELTDE